MGDHSHGHSHDDHAEHRGDGHGHSHDGNQREWERGFEFSLYKYIDTPRVRALNAVDPAAAARCFRPWEQRLHADDDPAAVLESDADDQLIVHVPFTGSVTLKAIRLIGGRDGTYPAELRVFINRDDIDFDNVQALQPTQQWQLLADDFVAEAEYQTKIAKFQGVSSLTLFFPRATDAETVRVTYIGLKGDFKPAVRTAVVTVYEATPNLADHKTKADSLVARSIQ